MSPWRELLVPTGQQAGWTPEAVLLFFSGDFFALLEFDLRFMSSSQLAWIFGYITTLCQLCWSCSNDWEAVGQFMNNDCGKVWNEDCNLLQLISISSFHPRSCLPSFLFVSNFTTELFLYFLSLACYSSCYLTLIHFDLTIIVTCLKSVSYFCAKFLVLL